MLRKQRGFPGAEPRKCQELRHEEVTSDWMGNDKHKSARQGSEVGEHGQNRKFRVPAKGEKPQLGEYTER